MILKKQLSVIIVSYNNVELLDQCLDSIFRYNDIDDALEVIVSDNSPDDKVVNHIKKRYRYVLVRKNKNEGFGAGNNRGEEISSGEYLLFLNPDTILVEPIFKFAIEQFENSPRIGAFGVQLIDKNIKKNPSFYMMDKYGILPTVCEKLCSRIGLYIDGKMYIAGADLFVRREAFLKAGRFDENIFMYDEEPDLLKRIKRYTMFNKTAFFDRKHIIHLEGGTSSQDANQEYNMRKRIIIADIYYAKKWGINLTKILRGKQRYVKFKSIIYFFTNRKKYNQQIEIIQLFEEEIIKNCS